MDLSTPPDLRTLDFEAFLTLIFDHPAYEGERWEGDEQGYARSIAPKEWYWELEWSWDECPADPLHTLALMTELFERAGELRGRFTSHQIGQGFWLLLGAGGGDVFWKPVWDAALPWEPREGLLRAVVPLYERLFDREPLDALEVAFMFWDMTLGYRYEDPSMAFPPSADDGRIQRVVIEVIEQQLFTLGGPWSVPAALHGVHHVHHPDAQALLERWLAAQGDDDSEWVQYGRRVLRGEAM